MTFINYLFRFSRNISTYFVGESKLTERNLLGSWRESLFSFQSLVLSYFFLRGILSFAEKMFLSKCSRGLLFVLSHVLKIPIHSYRPAWWRADTFRLGGIHTRFCQSSRILSVWTRRKCGDSSIKEGNVIWLKGNKKRDWRYYVPRTRPIGHAIVLSRFWMQLLGELGVENGQQPFVHSVHVHLWIIRPNDRHRRLLSQHLTCRQKGNLPAPKSLNKWHRPISLNNHPRHSLLVILTRLLNDADGQV